jgi:hypothetical protein
MSEKISGMYTLCAIMDGSGGGQLLLSYLVPLNM